MKRKESIRCGYIRTWSEHLNSVSKSKRKKTEKKTFLNCFDAKSEISYNISLQKFFFQNIHWHARITIKLAAKFVYISHTFFLAVLGYSPCVLLFAVSTREARVEERLFSLSNEHYLYFIFRFWYWKYISLSQFAHRKKARIYVSYLLLPLKRRVTFANHIYCCCNSFNWEHKRTGRKF